MDVPKNTRFAINYFTSIGLGVITEEMRVYLKVGSLAMVFLGRFEILTNINNLECPIN
jgi:pre-mRNA-splicing factor CWC22